MKIFANSVCVLTSLQDRDFENKFRWITYNVDEYFRVWNPDGGVVAVMNENEFSKFKREFECQM